MKTAEGTFATPSTTVRDLSAVRHPAMNPNGSIGANTKMRR